jgi:hypothetical protein
MGRMLRHDAAGESASTDAAGAQGCTHDHDSRAAGGLMDTPDGHADAGMPMDDLHDMPQGFNDSAGGDDWYGPSFGGADDALLADTQSLADYEAARRAVRSRSSLHCESYDPCARHRL